VHRGTWPLECWSARPTSSSRPAAPAAANLAAGAAAGLREALAAGLPDDMAEAPAVDLAGSHAVLGPATAAGTRWTLEGPGRPAGRVDARSWPHNPEIEAGIATCV